MNIPLERVGLLDDGIYKIRVTETEDRTSTNGNPYVNLTCSVLDERGQETGVQIWHTLTMTKKSMPMVGQFLDAVGAPTTGSISSRALKGKTFWAQVGKDTYQGRTKNVIKSPLTPEQAKKDADSIHNVFNMSADEETPSNGFHDDDVESWDNDDEDSTATLPEEMEDTKF